MSPLISVFCLTRPGTLFKKIMAKSSGHCIMSVVAIRHLSTMEVTKNITLISNDKKRERIVNFKLENPQKKPLVVMLPWLLAKTKHIKKYTQFYIEKGCDIMSVSLTPWQLLWPVKGTQLVAMDILKFLESNPSYQPLLINGFSVGGYLWSEALVHMAADLDRYQPIISRIHGQIWDSLADITEIPMGFPMAVFPRNKVLQSALRQYILYHMKTFDKVATCHYLRASQMFHTNIIKAPALFLVSKSDPIGSEKSNLRARDNWENMGIQVYWKCWDKSPHVMHFRHHPEEYKAEVSQFLDNIGFTAERIPSKMKAKL